MENLNLNKYKTLNQTKSKDKTELLIPTRRPLEILQSMGWHVVDVQEINSKKFAGYQPHMVRLQNKDYKNLIKNGYPELILKSAHIPKSAFKLTLGFYRTDTEENFMADDDTGMESVRHYGYDDNKIREAVLKVTSKIGLVLLNIQTFQNTKLSFLEENNFIERILKELDINPARLVDISYSLDLKDGIQGHRNLWQAINVIQNNIINGKYFIFSVNDKIRKAKVHTGMNQIELVSKTIWNIALDFIK